MMGPCPRTVTHQVWHERVRPGLEERLKDVLDRAPDGGRGGPGGEAQCRPLSLRRVGTTGCVCEHVWGSYSHQMRRKRQRLCGYE